MVDRVSLKGFIQLDQIEDLLSDLNSRLRFLENNLSNYQADKENDEKSMKVCSCLYTIRRLYTNLFVL